MKNFLFPLIATLAVTFIIAPAPLAAEHGEDEESHEPIDEEGGEVADEPTGPVTTDPASPESIVASLQASTRFCSKIGSSEYAIDCLAERLGALSKQLRGQEDFREVQTVLENAAKDLNKIARANRSDTLPPAYVSTQGATPIRTSRRLIPVDETKLDVAVAQALEVIATAETELLRSAEGSDDRALQFQQIASAIGSNKVLLRSV